MPIPSRRCFPAETPLEHHRSWIEALPGDDCRTILFEQIRDMRDLAASASTDQVDTIHAPYRWTIRQVFCHLAEAERFFGSRMLRVAAGEHGPLNVWDENAYAGQRYGLGNFDKMILEIEYLRQANLLFLDRISPSCWDRAGVLDSNPITLRGLSWVLAGHFAHHLRIVQRRLVQV